MLTEKLLAVKFPGLVWYHPDSSPELARVAYDGNDPQMPHALTACDGQSIGQPPRPDSQAEVEGPSPMNDSSQLLAASYFWP